VSETAAARSHGSKRTLAVCRLRQRPVKSRSRLQKPRQKALPTTVTSTGRNRPEPFRIPILFYFHRNLRHLLGARFITMANTGPTQNSAGQSPAANGLAIVRVTIGAMLVWVFFENLGKGLYTPAGYAGLINYYIKASHSPAAWKAVMGLAASHAAMAAPMQAVTEIGLGILLVIGLLTRPAAFVAFLYLGSLWVSEWGTSWIWELLVSVLASLALVVGRAGRAWGVDALLARRWPSSPWW
jgi:uncharacterized membrane protein YphA (DoxX/SURF4 family)